MCTLFPIHHRQYLNEESGTIKSIILIRTQYPLNNSFIFSVYLHFLARINFKIIFNQKGAAPGQRGGFSLNLINYLEWEIQIVNVGNQSPQTPSVSKSYPLLDRFLYSKHPKPSIIKPKQSPPATNPNPQTSLQPNSSAPLAPSPQNIDQFALIIKRHCSHVNFPGNVLVDFHAVVQSPFLQLATPVYLHTLLQKQQLKTGLTRSSGGNRFIETYAQAQIYLIRRLSLA